MADMMPITPRDIWRKLCLIPAMLAFVSAILMMFITPWGPLLWLMVLIGLGFHSWSLAKRNAFTRALLVMKPIDQVLSQPDEYFPDELDPDLYKLDVMEVVGYMCMECLISIVAGAAGFLALLGTCWLLGITSIRGTGLW